MTRAPIEERRPSLALGLGCVVAALAAVIVPVVVAVWFLLGLVRPDGDVVRELDESAVHVRLPNPFAAVSSAYPYIGAIDLPLEFGSDHSGPEAIYLSFPLELPPHSEVLTADIVFACADNLEGRGREPVTAVIELLDVDDMPGFTSSRFRTPADLQRIPVERDGAIGWEVDPWEAGESYATPDLAPLVERWLARAGYQPRNSIGLRIRGEGAAPAGTEDRSYLRAVSQVGSGTAPLLRLMVASPADE
jgi:hypothetical protein